MNGFRRHRGARSEEGGAQFHRCDDDVRDQFDTGIFFPEGPVRCTRRKDASKECMEAQGVHHRTSFSSSSPTIRSRWLNDQRLRARKWEDVGSSPTIGSPSSKLTVSGFNERKRDAAL